MGQNPDTESSKELIREVYKAALIISSYILHHDIQLPKHVLVALDIQYPENRFVNKILKPKSPNRPFAH